MAHSSVLSPLGLNDYQCRLTSGENVPENVYQFKRLSSFLPWPERAQASPVRLAKAGFFYMGNADEVECYSCHGKLKDWKLGENPLERHRFSYPACRHVKGIDKENRPISSDVDEKELKNSHTSSATLTYILNVLSHDTPPLESSPFPSIPVAQENHHNYTDRDTTQNNHQSSRQASQNVFNQQQRQSSNSVPHTSNVTNHAGDVADSFLLDVNPIVTERPKHPEYAAEQNRISSFQKWPIYKKPTPRDCAQAGFYYAGFGDSVKCFFCGGGLKNWETPDIPWREHARWFPKCGFVKQCKGIAFIREVQQERLRGPVNQGMSGDGHYIEDREIKARLDAPMAQTLVNMGYPKSKIQCAIEHRLRTHGDDFPNLQTFVEAVLELDDDKIQSETGNVAESSYVRPQAHSPPDVVFGSLAEGPPRSAQAKPKKTKKAWVPPKSGGGKLKPAEKAKGEKDKESKSDELKRLKYQYDELRKQRMCKDCCENEASIVFLPCSHLTSCALCAPKLQSCPYCSCAIKGTVPIYMP